MMRHVIGKCINNTTYLMTLSTTTYANAGLYTVILFVKSGGDIRHRGDGVYTSREDSDATELPIRHN